MKVYLFHLMPYAYLDLDYDKQYKSCWVIYPNTNFDPVKGYELYNRYLDELEYGEQLGFDGLCVNEHHQNAYGLMPSPIVPAAALARRTTKAKIAILGSAFGLRDHPLTLAEEHAMIDCITGGRLISGMVRGLGCEYYSMGANPALSHARFQEAHDLVVQAWTRPGPFAFEGKHYHFEYVNLWPRPYQRPHPTIWIPSQGSTETIEWSSHPARKYTYLQTYSPFRNVKRFHDAYRQQAHDYGYTATAEQLGWAAPIYVGETDEEARREAAPHMEAFFNKFLRYPAEMLLPPGFLSLNSIKRVMKTKSSLKNTHTIDTLMAERVVIVGSRETVRKQILEAHAEVGLGYFLGMFQTATMPHDITMRSMERFARDVMPALQASTGEGRWEPSKGVVAAE
ncbi:MAG: LLM class flavin-dependent oxidoreductase [Alphaproteobacteria bacterium]|nr:LLM class flavin-dependent oxidoreductase [Alphaproteobacteria bacterium]